MDQDQDRDTPPRGIIPTAAQELTRVVTRGGAPSAYLLRLVEAQARQGTARPGGLWERSK